MSVAATLFAGCSDGGTGTIDPHTLQAGSTGGSNTTSGLRRPDHVLLPVPGTPGGAQVFVSAGSDFTQTVVYILNAAGTITSTLTGFGFPNGMAVDHSGNLYVADTGSDHVLEFAPPYTGTPMTIHDPNQNPVDVAVDSGGNLAVTNAAQGGGPGGSVSLYTAGSTYPTNVISSPDFQFPAFCAFDKNGNLLLDGSSNAGKPIVEGILHGVHGTSLTTLTTANSLEQPGGIGISTSGNIAIQDVGASAIYTYAAPRGTNLGSPVSTTPLTGGSVSLDFAFVPGSTLVLTAGAYPNVVQLFKYPLGGSPIKSVSLSSGFEGIPIPNGVAINPTEQFTLH